LREFASCVLFAIPPVTMIFPKMEGRRGKFALLIKAAAGMKAFTLRNTIKGTRRAPVDSAWKRG